MNPQETPPPPSNVIAPGGPGVPAAPNAPIPAAPPTAPVMPASIMGGKPTSKKKWIAVAVVAAAVLLLGGGAAAAYYGYIVPNQPENVLKAALVNSYSGERLTSQHFAGRVSLKDKQAKGTYTANFQGSANNQGNFELKADIDVAVTKVTVDLRGIDGKTVYAKVGGLTGLPELLSTYGDEESAAYAPIIAAINDKWLEINQSVLGELNGGDGSGWKPTPSDRTKLAAAYGQHQFLSIQQKLKDEKINDMDSYHFKVGVDKQELQAFMRAVKDAKLAGVQLSQENIDAFNETVRSMDFSRYPAEVWIAKDTKFIDQIVLTYGNKDVSTDLRVTFSDFNKPVTVVKPAGAKSILEVISQLFTGTPADQQSILENLQSTGISL